MLTVFILLIIAALAIIVLVPDLNPFTPDSGVAPTPPSSATPTPYSPTGEIHTATAKWNIRDALNLVVTGSSDTGYVCIARATNGVFNFLSPVEETEFDAAPDTSTSYYTTGDELIIVVTSDNDPTSGDETYSRWFYIKSLDDGVPIKAFPISNPKAALTGSAGNWKVNEAVLENSNQYVRWLSDENKSWVFGNYFDVYGRVDNTAIVQQITNKGVVLTTVNDGATWDDTSGEVNANVTFTSDEEDLYFEIVGEAADVCWGLPQLVVESDGGITQYDAVLFFGTEAVNIATSPLLADGWQPINWVGLTGNVSFYYVIDPIRDGCIPDAMGEVFSVRIPISISDSGLTASTEYDYCASMMDYQVKEDVARGAFKTSVPTGRGFLTDFGADTVIQATAPTVSSNILATPQLYGYFTTNA